MSSSILRELPGNRHSVRPTERYLTWHNGRRSIIVFFIMRLKGFAAAVCLLNVTAIAFSQSTPPAAAVSQETRAAAARLAGDILINGKNYEFDRQLADTIGPRLTASSNYEHAVEWAQQQFKDMGLVNVHTEPFTMPAAWEPETPATGKMLTPRVQQLHIFSTGWSPSTPSGGVKGSVYFVEHLVPVDKLSAAEKEKIKGNIVMLTFGSLIAEGGSHLRFGEAFDAVRSLKDLGAQAVLFPGNTNGSESAFAFTFTGTMLPLPIAELGSEDFLLLKRLAAAGPVTVEFSYRNRVRENVKTENVVAEIKGRDLPDDYVIVGGHLDSWHPGTGAQDNGTGATGVMEVARAVQALGRPPRRTMRFILFGGEEEGLVGSNAYAKAHAADASKIDVVIVSDTGSEQAKGFFLMGRNDEKSDMEPYEPLLAGLGGDKTTDEVDFMFQTDHASMEMQGIPELVLWTDVTKYFKLHHKASDTFDSIDQHDFTQGVAVLAVTSYAIADSSQPFAKHLSQDEVDKMLKDVKQYDRYEDLKKQGLF